MPHVLALESGTVVYDGARVLDSIDFSVESGDFIALLGANGAGKTTLIRVLLGLTPLNQGKVWLYGTPIAEFKDWHRLALVPQRLPVVGSVPISVEELVRSGVTGPGLRRPRKADVARAVDDALELVDLADRRKHRLDALSGGQQRRALIARALASGAETFVMDEPTAGVDAASQIRLAQALGRISESGRTVLLVTHELGPLEELVTRTVVLSAGHITYDGAKPPAEFLHDHVHHHSHDDPHKPSPGSIMESP